MVYSTQSCGVFGSRNTTFRKLDLLTSSYEGGRKHLLSWAPYKELILITPPPLRLRTETDQVSETSCFYSMEIVQKSRNSVIQKCSF
jgi:hypothetical protein